MEDSRAARKAARQKRKLERARKESQAATYKARKKVEKRNTSLIVIIVSVVCVAIMALAVWDKKVNEPARAAEQASELAAQQASEAAKEAEANAPKEIVPQDPSKPAGEAVAHSEAATVATTPVACDGKEPENAGATRDLYPGGPTQVLEEGKDYVAEIATSCGTIVMDLLEDQAPLTTNSFAFLSNKTFFDGLEIFRNATSIGALQTGAGTNVANWSIGYSIPDELAVAKEGYAKGDVAMANAGPHTGGSQFFFVYNDLFKLPPNYATFGFVIDGMDVLDKIGAIKADGETPTERVYMETVTIREKTDADKKLVEAADKERVEARKRTNG